MMLQLFAENGAGNGTGAGTNTQQGAGNTAGTNGGATGANMQQGVNTPQGNLNTQNEQYHRMDRHFPEGIMTKSSPCWILRQRRKKMLC